MNYKPALQEFTIAGVTRRYSAKLIQLYDSPILSTTADSLLDSRGDDQYQSPSSTVFVIIGVRVEGGNVASSVLIYSGATEDAETTLHLTCRHATGTNIQEYYVDDIAMDANSYVVYNPGGTSLAFITVWGYERPA